MKHLDLFSGIGGFALACQWNGIETIGFVEIDKYCQKVLRKHWPNVPIVEDIRDVKEIQRIIANAISQRRYATVATTRSDKGDDGRLFTENPIGETEVCSPERNECFATNVLITAGFPCQPFSVAGKQLSQADDRYLWPQTIAVIKEINPSWVLLENVTGIINLALDTVLSDLEGAGYAYETLIIPACAVNAWHRRDRVWIIAYSNGNSKPIMPINGRKGQGKLGDRFTTDTESMGWREGADQGQANTGKQHGDRGWNKMGNEFSHEDWWAVEPELGRVAHGISHRVDRLKCLGNAIVPQVAYEIIKVIKEVNNG